jgi:hypothetical protein
MTTGGSFSRCDNSRWDGIGLSSSALAVAIPAAEITRSDYTALQYRRRGEGERGPGRGPAASPKLCIVGIASSERGASVQVGR